MSMNVTTLSMFLRPILTAASVWRRRKNYDVGESFCNYLVWMKNEYLGTKVGLKDCLAPFKNRQTKTKNRQISYFENRICVGEKKIWVDYFETGSISFTCLKLSITKVMQSCFAKNRWCQSINRKLFNCSRNGSDYLKIDGKRYL